MDVNLFLSDFVDAMQRQFDAQGQLNFSELFSTDPSLPVKIEVGSGTGEWAAAQAKASNLSMEECAARREGRGPLGRLMWRLRLKAMQAEMFRKAAARTAAPAEAGPAV